MQLSIPSIHFRSSLLDSFVIVDATTLVAVELKHFLFLVTSYRDRDRRIQSYHPRLSLLKPTSISMLEEPNWEVLEGAESFDSMNEIITNLWLGNISSALDTNTLKEKNIHSIVSVLRENMSIDHTFLHHRIPIQDVPETDILSHFIPAITFIDKELSKGQGVLVHCFAGISRSTTIVAAYLMYSQGLDVKESLKLIRQSRSFVEPNHAFMSQLEIFHKAQHTVSSEDKATRMFYLERVVKQVVNAKGDETLLKDVLTKLPSGNAKPNLKSLPRRRIRCKMCRQELATRDHIMEHGETALPSVPPEPEPLEPAEPPKNSENITSSGELVSLSPKEPTQDTKAISAPSNATPVDAVSKSPSLLPKLIPLPASFASRLIRPIQTRLTVSPPILTNVKCSGYFVEPLKWMEPFLAKGENAGKILCPNKKCGAKLGNYDWAGVHCSCNEWIVPGFCIHRSKVDEVT
ncbi:hypothetical protein QCA50_007332 [Cerrena zonata]|uniref:protein-tyrosine-phosphatase n=1 Tax=Cerrena zonata TaxID=2478898 RepID=A0AAW0GEI0_9APHY